MGQARNGLMLVVDHEISGTPASCQLFEQLRDSSELQRHAKNIYCAPS